MSQFRAVALGILGAGALAAGVQAQSYTYATGDLVAAFRKTGKSDLEVDLGSISYLKGLSQTVTFNTQYDPLTQLIPTFDDVNSLNFAVFGTQRGAGGASAANTSWLTKARTDVNTQTTAPNNFTTSKLGNVQSAISGIAGDGASTGALNYSPSASYPPSSAHAIVIPNSGTAAANSFTTKFGGSGGLQSLVPTPGIENTTPANFSTTPGGFVVSDLYEYIPGASGTPTTYLGYFTLANDGVLSYTPVPEPSTLALAGVGLTLFVFLRDRRNAGSKKA